MDNSPQKTIDFLTESLAEAQAKIKKLEKEKEEAYNKGYDTAFRNVAVNGI